MVSRAAAACALLVASCDPGPTAGPEPPTPVTPAKAASPAPEPPDVPACSAEMVLVDGAFCPAADERCARYLEEYESDPDKSERCIAFEPSRCVSKRRTVMRFCIDRYEWPNRAGDLPQVLVSFSEAKSACEAAGKRLCDADEWLFACEGESMSPYVYGLERDDTACLIDRPYRSRPSTPLDRWDRCMASESCRRAFEKLDQRAPSGSFARCVSPFGAHDLNGSVNEWVNLPGEPFPHRSGLKGGWWGPVRNRCRPTVRFHDESDWGYEIGFRCCREAKP